MESDNEKAMLDACADLSNEVYKSTQLYETLEYKGLVYGNGHHMRQKVAEFAVNLLKERWIEKKD